MRVLGWIVLSAFAITAFNAAIGFVLVVIMAALVLCLLRAPVETLKILLCFTFLNALAAYPASAIALIALCAIGWLAR